MPFSRLQLLPERDRPNDDAVWLHGFDGSQTILVSISHDDLDNFVQQRRWGPLATGDDDYLVSVNLANLLPVAEGRRIRGDLKQHTDPTTGQVTPLIELTPDDLGQGIKRLERFPGDSSGSRVGWIAVDVREDGATRRVGAIPPLPRPRNPDRPTTGHIATIPVQFHYLYGDIASVLVGSREAADQLPGFTAIRGSPIELADDAAEAPEAVPVFISYKGEDSYTAEILTTALAVRGFTCQSPWQFRTPSQVRVDEMIRSSRALIVIRSGRDLSINMQAEIHLAHAENKSIITLGIKNYNSESSSDYIEDYFISDAASWENVVDAVVRAINLPRPGNISALDKPAKKPRKKKPPKSVEQRPAAYRFTTAGDKIDVLPEPPEPLDRQFAVDTQQELLRKAHALLARLHNSRSAQRVCDSVRGLIDGLEKPFDELRPAVLLSRVRSLEADGAAFDTDGARAELFTEAFAQVADAINTSRDLLGMFPSVRRVEVERVALDLHHRPDAVPAIEHHANEIKVAAEKSGAATEDAIQALARNDAAIKAAIDPVLRNELVAAKLLVIGNFTRVAAGKAWGELSEVGAASWAEFKEKFPKGVGVAVLAAPMMALMSLTGAIAGSVIGIAVAVPAWKALSGVYKKMVGPAVQERHISDDARATQVNRAKTLKTKDQIIALALREVRAKHILGIYHIDIEYYVKLNRMEWHLQVNNVPTYDRDAFSTRVLSHEELSRRAIFQEIEKNIKDKFDLRLNDTKRRGRSKG